MTVAPDGRLFVTEKGGWTNAGSPLQSRVRVIKDGALLPTPFATLPSVYGGGERGLLGITLDPAFATNQFVYVFYTFRVGDGTFRNRIVRLTAEGDVAQNVGGVPTETLIFELPDQASNQSHQGGGVHFGSDGKLYVTTGDNSEPDKSQSLSSIYGKMLRLNPDGSIPPDNPFVGAGAAGNYQSIWARGLRNPFTFAVQPGSGRILINDVGETTFEEIDDGIRGSNYGWPLSEGPTSDPRFRSPLFAYGHEPSTSGAVSGCAITGGTFYNPSVASFPADHVGDYFFADFCGDYIKRFDLASGTVTDFADTEARPVDLQVGTDGSLYYLTYNGTVVRIGYTGSTQPSISQQPQPWLASVGEAARFTVSATGAAPLSYEWQRNGVPIPGATAAQYDIPSTTLADDGALFRVVVRNSAGSVTSTAARLTVTTNHRPAAVITSPEIGTRYTAFELISFSGSGGDTEDGPLPPSAFTWRVDFHHDDHVHPFISDMTGTAADSFIVPRVGETETNVWYRLHLSVRDSGGLLGETFRDVHPELVTLALSTVPTGLALDLDGQPRSTPFATPSVAGLIRTLSAPDPQLLNGDMYEFVSWSDGASRTHVIDGLDTSTSYVATYRKINAPDLVVTNVSWSPASPAVGTGVRFSATIKNQGSAATPAGVVHGVGFKIDGVTRTWSDTATASIPPGGSVALSANGGGLAGLWTATVGAHTVLAHVDDINRIPGEANETNNTLSTPLTVTALPAVPVVLTVSPAADAFANAGAPTTNYGSNASLLSRGTPGAASYLRFVIPAAPAGKSLTGAVLRLRTTTDSTSGSAASHTIKVAGDGWTETGLTWNNKPAIAGALLGTISGATVVNTQYDTVLTPSALAGLLGTTQTLGISSTGTDSLYVWSRNFGTVASRPQLVLTFTPDSTDTSPPTTPIGLTTLVSGPSVALSWTASTDDTGVTGYEVHRSAFAGFTPTTATKVATPTGTSHTEAPGVGTWYYRVLAKDAAGNASPPSSDTAATVADTTPPSTPGTPTATVTGSTVSLSWAGSTDAFGVTGYELHRSSTTGFVPTVTTRVSTVTGTSTSDSPGLGTWYYVLVAKDAAGNASTPSDQAVATISTTGTPTVLTVSPTADAFGNSGAPTTNYGSNASLLSRGTPGAASYLRFVIPAAPAGKSLTGAVLRLRTTTDSTAGSATNHTIKVAGDGWTEAGLTWNNKPAISGALLGTITGATAVNRQYDTTLTPAAVATLLGTTQTLGISSTGTDSLYLWSRNYATTTARPQLILTFT